MARDGSMKSKNTPKSRALEAFQLATVMQVGAFEKRANSLIEKEYGRAMQRAANALAQITQSESFEALIRAEQTLQKNDLTVYAHRPALVASVQDGIDDINDGLAVYTQLVTDAPAYAAHRYRKKERLPPEYTIPLDAMRRAIRGQIKRVENYRANVMGNTSEQAFLSARIELLHQAEAQYDSLQRKRLLKQQTPGSAGGLSG